MEVSKLYNGEVTLEFHGEGKRHDYIWREESADLPSSTQIAGIIDKPGLRYWYVNKALERASNAIKPGVSYDEVQLGKIFKKAKYGGADSRDDSADVGKLVHKWIENHVSALIAGGKGSIQMPKHAGAVRSIENFLNWEFQVKPKYIFSERRLLSKKTKCCGTLDIGALVDPFHLGLEKKPGKLYTWLPTITDVKTGKNVYPEYWLQLASYAMMLSEEQPKNWPFILQDTQRLIVNISQADGTIKTPVAKSDITEDTEIFLALRQIYRWKEGK